jgi:hypothetical protein
MRRGMGWMRGAQFSFSPVRRLPRRPVLAQVADSDGGYCSVGQERAE